MKTIKNIQIMAGETPAIEAGTQQQLTVVRCVKALLDNVEYKNRGDQRTADKLYEKLSDVNEETFDLEDAEYAFIKGYIEGYKPFLNGRMFTVVLNQFDE